jgi:5-methyltetrahydrofolate--homocysteine methyltransferase
MTRRNMHLPLLIGGATTSRQHTAVKIAPEFRQPVVHVPDASRVVDVVASLMNPELSANFARANREEQSRLRDQHSARRDRPTLSYAEARRNRQRLQYEPAVPAFTGTHQVDVDLKELVPFIDWTFFFSAWELKGRFPAILDHPEFGSAARDLFGQAQRILDRIVSGRLLRARGVYGFWPANSDGDDIVLYASGATRASADAEIVRFPMLRQQEVIADDRPNRSLADFVAPIEGGVLDYVGAFAVTSGHGVDDLVRRFEGEHDDYSAIIVKALADRLAEAFAEYLHAQARRDFGYETAQPLSNDDLIDENYRGIRPAFGYPACPDHSEKRRLFDLLGARSIGMELTETCAMTPAASVSGLYLAHPQAKYFVIQRIAQDQVEDYARRLGMAVGEVERALRPILNYDPTPAGAAR